MKKYIFLYLFLSLSWLVKSQDVITLNSPYTGSGIEKACEGFILKPGFSFSSSGGGNLTLSIDKNVCPPYTETPVDVNPLQNYILTVTPTQETDKVQITKGVIETGRETSYQTTIQYLDGLGRPVNTVQRGITPSGADLIDHIEYDAFGREFRQWLPVPFSNNNGADPTPSEFRTASENYKAYNEGKAYVELMYESSPLNRVTGNKNPGTDWHSHPTAIEYGTNGANEVRAFILTEGELDGAGYYPAGQLYKTVTKDEDNKTVTEYKDKLDRVVMTRQGTGRIQAGFLDTYYVYDEFGNLRYVIPPMLSDKLNNEEYKDDDIILQQYAYVYKYDNRNRCIKKRLPGCDWVYMIYDKSDRLVQMQDGNQRLVNKWTVYKYDKTGRLLYTSEVVDKGDFTTMLSNYSGWLVVEEFSTTGHQWEQEDTGYSKGFYHLAPTDMLTVNYYDSYDFLELPAYKSTKSSFSYTPHEGYGSPYENAKGLLTGTRTYLLDGSGKYLTEVYYYDYRGQLIQKRADNHINGYDITYNQYDFAGNVTKSLITHTAQDYYSYSVREEYTYSYDHAGRLIQTRYKADDKAEIILVQNEYDELGRLTNKKRHNNTDTEQYDYNIRNWLTRIKSGNYEQNYYYNKKFPYHTDGLVSYNGNISATTWTYDGTVNGYHYQHDAYNRLGGTYAVLNSQLDVDYRMSEQFYYDKHGNIVSLIRGDNRDTMDQLTFSYNGNQLKKVTDRGISQYLSSIKEYQDLSNKETEFYYDANGNMIEDSDRRIVTIQYNLLNLPDLVQFADGQQILNTYDANGRKLKTRYYTLKTPLAVPLSGGEVLDLANKPTYMFNYDVTVYAGNKEYELMEPKHYAWLKLNRIKNPEGYIANGKYHYYRRDHLGNNREVWQTDGNTVATIQRTQYYPSGLPWAYGENDGASEQPYKYNDKEFIEMHGLDEYDSQARMYYPAIMRPTTMDPLAERHYSISPYAWCANNPVNRFDPDGRDWYIFNEETGEYEEKQEAKGTHRMVVRSTDKNGNITYKFYSFADPVDDPNNIEEGIITQFIAVSESKIQSMLENQGAFDSNIFSFAWNSQGRKKFDYSAIVLPFEYPGSYFDGKNSNSLFLPEGGHTVHNFMNFGNFLWGATGYAVGLNYAALQAGAHLNNILNPQRNGYKRQWDSEDDQRSIRLGIFHAQQNNYRKK